jgi:RHS repeat-associated protein
VRLSWLRVVSATCVALAAVSVGIAVHPGAAITSMRPKVQKERVLPHRDLRPAVHRRRVAAAQSSVTRAARAWPTAGSAEVSFPADTRGQVNMRRAGTLPIMLRGGAGARMRVQIRDQAEANRAGVAGLLFTLTRTDTSGAALSLTVDYASFRDAGGADYGHRLHLVTLPGCALTTPQVAKCQVQTPIASHNDAAHALLAGAVGGSSANARSWTSTTEPSAPLARAAGSSVVLAAVAGASGPNGSFTATSLSPSASWPVGGGSGDFEWSYPINVPPPAAGTDVAPSVALSYNSGSVDGQVADTNNQSSWVGEGWDYNPGYIERTYRTCADDASLPAEQQTGDLCWAGQIVTMNLGEHTTALVRDDSSGDWHPANDDGSRVELLTGSGNGARNGEYWRVTTTDGVQYYFGRNSLPGGATATQNSVWTVPVYGAHPGDPCYQAGDFPGSRCTQSWRWNLDYVEDPHGNATAYSYTAETNYYGADNAATPVSYIRGGYLTYIDYGLHDVNDRLAGYPAPQRISFGVAERCIPDASFDCAESDFTAANADHWPDTPQDQDCPPSGPCNNHAPSFWSRKRLRTITTSLYDGAIDTYTLTQSVPDLNDSHLVLDSIVRKGFAADDSSLLLPAVAFGTTLMDNRVAGYNAEPAMLGRRLTNIFTETGLSISIVYSQGGRSAPLCDQSTLPVAPTDTDLANNTRECFPVEWTPAGETQQILDFFHKYVVTEVDADDADATAPDRHTTYDYVGDPAWHYDDNEVVKPADRTYGQFRGYGTVQVRTGNQNNASNGVPDAWTLTTTTYYRGMDGDRLPGGTRSVSVTDSLGETVTDSNPFADAVRELQTFNGSSGTEVSTTITTMGTVTSTATRDRTGLPALTANVTDPTLKRTYTNLADGAYRNSTSSYNYDDLGRLTRQTDSGTGVPNVCTATDYADNTNAWIRDRVAETIKSAQICPTSGAAAQVLSDKRTYYDGSTTLGTVGAYGDPTRTQTATSDTQHFATTTATFDSYGRPKTSTVYTSAGDTSGRSTVTDYTPADGGPLTRVDVTNPAEQTTTALLDERRGLTFETIDVAGHITRASYDPLGRLTALWKPGQMAGTGQATIIYDYWVRSDGPLAVITKTLVDPGQGATPSYRTSISLYDAFGALRQTQTNAVGGGRVITDTYRDSHGWVIRTNNRWITSGAPDTTLVATADSGIDSRTLVAHDGTGRTTLSTEYQGTIAKWNTRTVYGGDRTTVIPPTGGVETTTVTDARGQTAEIDRWTSPPMVSGNVISGGVANKTTYQYTPLGQQDQMTTAAGTSLAATWTTSYDLAGRVVSRSDPDAGVTRSTYDDAGDLTSATDALGRTLAYTYDDLGRKIAEYDGSTSGTKLASWAYDTLQAGRLTSSTRYAADGNYTVAATGYDAAGRLTGSTTSLPASMTSLGFDASYTTSYTWTSTGQMATQVPARGGGLKPETLQYGYDPFGDPTTLTAVGANYVWGSWYSPFGEPNQYELGVSYITAWLTLSREAQTRRITTANLTTDMAIPQVENVNYAYDPAGNITRAIDTQGATNAPIETQCYRYSALDELTTAWSATDNCTTTPTDGNRSMVGGAQPYWQSWTTDAAGNRTSQIDYAPPGSGSADTITTYTFGAGGHAHALASATSTTGDAAQTDGYYLYSGHGNVYNSTNATWYGSNTSVSNIAGMAVTPTGKGYWLVGSDGKRYPHGDAENVGTVSTSYAHPIIGMVANPTGGYYLYTAHGNVYNSADATWYGSSTSVSNIAGMDVTPTGKGYWLVGSDGTLYPHGDGAKIGTTSTSYANPIKGIAATPTTATVASTTTATNYGYDAAGQTLTRTGHAGGDQVLTWSAEGRLATVTTPAGQVSYTYSADGDQIVRRDSDNAVTLYLPGEELIRSSSGAITGIRYYTHNGTVVAERVGMSNPMFLFADPHGTVDTAVPTDANGAADTPIRRHFDPYGNPLGSNPAWFDAHTFLNHPQDVTSGLVDLGARNYDSVAGRFLSVDPILDPSDPQQANGYNYAANNPITFTDPDGTMPQAGGGECCAGYDCDTNDGAVPPMAPGDCEPSGPGWGVGRSGFSADDSAAPPSSGVTQALVGIPDHACSDGLSAIGSDRGTGSRGCEGRISSTA